MGAIVFMFHVNNTVHAVLNHVDKTLDVGEMTDGTLQNNQLSVKMVFRLSFMIRRGLELSNLHVDLFV